MSWRPWKKAVGMATLLLLAFPSSAFADLNGTMSDILADIPNQAATFLYNFRALMGFLILIIVAMAVGGWLISLALRARG